MRLVRGFTLIELVIVVAILAIVAAIAVPMFTEQLAKSRRSEAAQVLSELQLLQEKWRSNHTTYATLDQLVAPASAAQFNASKEYYTFAVTAGSNTATDAAMTATPKGAQTGDRCGTFTLRIDNNNNNDPVGQVDKTASLDTCW